MRMEINFEWHGRNKMPENATTEKKIKWHLAHAKNCACRPIPQKIMNEIRKRKK